MIIASHRRSGTHLLINSFFLSYGRLSRMRFKLLKTHGMADEIRQRTAVVEIAEARRLSLVDSPPTRPAVCIVRDVRDVLASNFRWWKESGESACGGILEHFRNMTPGEWIRGECRLRAVPRPIRGCSVTQAHAEHGIFHDPAAFWARHVTSFMESDIPVVRFEDLLTDPAPVLRRVAGAWGIRPPRQARVPEQPVGYLPGKGAIGAHTQLFGAAELDVIQEKAGQAMTALGYS
jgi:hypothetical protein